MRKFAICTAVGAVMTLHAVAQNTFPATGNVGIGTMNPVTALDIYSSTGGWQAAGGIRISGQNPGLQIVDLTSAQAWLIANGAASQHDGELSFYDYTNNKSVLTLVESSGNVGIGTTSPNAYFHGGTNTVLEVSNPGTASNSQAQLILSTGATSNLGSAGTVTWVTKNSTGNRGLAYIAGQLSNDSTTNASGKLVFATANGSTPVANMLLDGTGNLGIGTTSPGAKLEVNGSLKLTSGSGASITFPDGTVQSTAYTGVICGGDFAESINVTGKRAAYEPGDVLVIDAQAPGKFQKSSKPYSTTVLGIYSTKPGVVGRRLTTPESPEEVPMAMVGIVPTKVSAENGAIEPGDLLVTSSLPGYAMKGTDRSRMLGAVIGKALGKLEEGTGVMEVGVTLQ